MAANPINKVYIVYSPENIQGGGSDTTLRGIFSSFEEAKKAAQSMASLDTFRQWLNFPIEFKDLYDKGDHSVYGLSELMITEVPFGQAMNEEFCDLPNLGKVITRSNHPGIQNHGWFAKYQQAYDTYVKSHKVNFDKYVKDE